MLQPCFRGSARSAIKVFSMKTGWRSRTTLTSLKLTLMTGLHLGDWGIKVGLVKWHCDQDVSNSCLIDVTFINFFDIIQHVQVFPHFRARGSIKDYEQHASKRREDHFNRSYLCILDIRCNSISSLPRKPFANGLFSIFSWVIWNSKQRFLVITYSEK